MKMAAYNFRYLFVTLLTIQFAFCLPTNTVNEEDFLKTGHNEFMQRSAERATNAARLILRDRTLVPKHSIEVEKFKKNLTDLISEYEAVKNPEEYAQVVEHFGKLNDYYLEMPQAKKTTDTTFVETILKKYECDKITKEIKQKMEEFMEHFMQAFAKAMVG